MCCDDNRIENVFKAGELRDRLLTGRGHHFMWSALRNHVPIFQHDDLLSERKHFLAAVRDVKDGNAMLTVPGAQVVDDLRLRRGIEGGQRFVKKQQARIGYQRASQRNPLALSTGNFSGSAIAQVRNAERSENPINSLA